MRVETDKAGTLYREYLRDKFLLYPTGYVSDYSPVKVSRKQLCFSKVFFSPEDLGPEFFNTPFSKAFFSAVQKLGLPQREASVDLQRKGEFFSTFLDPGMLTIPAYLGDSPEAASPYVQLVKTITRGGVACNGLETGEQTLDQIISEIRGGSMEPFAEALTIRLPEAQIHLFNGFSLGKYFANNLASHGDGALYDNTAKSLSVTLRADWIEKAGFQPRIPVELERNATPEQMAGKAISILDAYLARRQ